MVRVTASLLWRSNSNLFGIYTVRLIRLLAQMNRLMATCSRLPYSIFLTWGRLISVVLYHLNERRYKRIIICLINQICTVGSGVESKITLFGDESKLQKCTMLASFSFKASYLWTGLLVFYAKELFLWLTLLSTYPLTWSSMKDLRIRYLKNLFFMWSHLVI